MNKLADGIPSYLPKAMRYWDTAAITTGILLLLHETLGYCCYYSTTFPHSVAALQPHTAQRGAAAAWGARLPVSVTQRSGSCTAARAQAAGYRRSLRVRDSICFQQPSVALSSSRS